MSVEHIRDLLIMYSCMPCQLQQYTRLDQVEWALPSRYRPTMQPFVADHDADRSLVMYGFRGGSHAPVKVSGKKLSLRMTDQFPDRQCGIRSAYVTKG